MGRPSKAARAADETVSKKARLTIAQLAAYDDVLTDVLVDHVSHFPAHLAMLTFPIRSSPGTMSAKTWIHGEFGTTNTLGASAERM